MKAWVYQDAKQVAKRGAKAASWYAGWLDPEGRRRCRSCGPGAAGKRAAEMLARKVEVQIAAGTYGAEERQTWEQFRKDYDRRVLDGMPATSRELAMRAVSAFERHIKPKRMASITSATIEDFVAKRRKDRGKKPGSKIAETTVNRDLRHLKAMLRRAAKWGYLDRAPDFVMLRETKKLPTYVPPEHYVLIYAAADGAVAPADIPGVTPANWWRALLTTCFLTGWRIGEVLGLRWKELDLEAQTAFLEGDKTKGRADAIVPLHPSIFDHLEHIRSFDERVFPWDHERGTLQSHFDRLQVAAGVTPGRKDHYTFHDLRRSFATLNADRISRDALRQLMRHQSAATTDLYIAIAHKLRPSLQDVYVPPLPKRDSAEDAG